MLALLRGRQDRAPPRHGQEPRAHPEDHDRHALGHAHRRARSRRARAPRSSTRSRCATSSAPASSWTSPRASGRSSPPRTSRPRARSPRSARATSSSSTPAGTTRTPTRRSTTPTRPATTRRPASGSSSARSRRSAPTPQALDHPLGTAIGPHGPAEETGGLLPWACREYEELTGHPVKQDFPYWEPCHNAILSHGIYGFENIGGDLDAVTGKRVTFAAFPWRWVGGDGCIVRLVAITDPSGEYRLEPGS